MNRASSTPHKSSKVSFSFSLDSPEKVYDQPAVPETFTMENFLRNLKHMENKEVQARADCENEKVKARADREMEKIKARSDGEIEKKTKRKLFDPTIYEEESFKAPQHTSMMNSMSQMRNLKHMENEEVKARADCEDEKIKARSDGEKEKKTKRKLFDPSIYEEESFKALQHTSMMDAMSKNLNDMNAKKTYMRPKK